MVGKLLSQTPPVRGTGMDQVGRADDTMLAKALALQIPHTRRRRTGKLTSLRKLENTATLVTIA